jgi:hypothetical protein
MRWSEGVVKNKVYIHSLKEKKQQENKVGKSMEMEQNVDNLSCYVRTCTNKI